jgi:hypothetical protein
MKKVFELVVEIDKDGWPSIVLTEAESGHAMKVSGENSRTFPGAMDKLERALWSAVSGCIERMDEEEKNHED